jgi:dynein intermediate chain 1, axonemal
LLRTESLLSWANLLFTVLQTQIDDLYHEPVRRFVKPKNQVQLTQEELKNEVPRILTGDDPNRPKNISTFSYKDGCFKLQPPGPSDHMAVHLIQDSASLHIDSKDYRNLNQIKEKLKDSATSPDTNSKSMSDDIMSNKNQFNFSDRATQTLNNKLRNRYVSTEPPPVAQYSANVSQWDIYDSYITELRISKMEHADNAIDLNLPISDNEDIKKEISFSQSHEDDSGGMHTMEMLKALKILERIVNQNSQDEIYQDFKYWEDASDEFRHGEGSLLPLWRFLFDSTRKKHVTSICWNSLHEDMFAVGYGSYNFLHQKSGAICCFSLKNTSYPEYIFLTESGVLTIDFHPNHPSLLAVGYYDGNVAVFDIATRSSKPIFSSSIASGQHRDPVWQVRWHRQNRVFNSISSDGTVLRWCLNKNELNTELVMQLKCIPSSFPDCDETNILGLASGCCFDFSPKHDELFLVGTEEGMIMKCNVSSAQQLESYHGHHMAVYTVQWSPFEDDIFISCSADWTVKIWNHNNGTPLLSLDLGSAVGDVMWSPYSSTILAAVTSDGKVHIYDLNENKMDPLCRQKIVKNSRLSKIRFSTGSILLVGDDRGGISSLKLSPNLRRSLNEQGKECEKQNQIESLRAVFG